MADLLADIRMIPRYTQRDQTTFTRVHKLLLPGQTDRIPLFNIRSLPRLHDMNPSIYVCAIALLNENVDDPSAIREHPIFRSLIDKLGFQRSSKKREVQESHKASLILLEVFIYMVMIHQARSQAEAARPSSQEEELLI